MKRTTYVAKCVKCDTYMRDSTWGENNERVLMTNPGTLLDAWICDNPKYLNGSEYLSDCCGSKERKIVRLEITETIPTEEELKQVVEEKNEEERRNNFYCCGRCCPYLKDKG